MNTNEVTRVKKTALTADEFVTRSNDPKFYSSLDVLPNPDPILRKIGKRDDVFDAIGADSQVMSDKRSIRSGLLRFEWRVAPGGESPADMRAFELCQRFLQQKPAPGMRWADIIWNMATSVFNGMRVHEVPWQRDGNVIMPAKVVDKPNRRFAFNLDNDLRYLVREEPIKGLEADAFRFLVTRHMPSFDNPYGEAIYSSCFWWYTFKHAGAKFFAKFAEKYGFPWPIGKYPEGAGDKEIEALLKALQQMVEDAVCAIPQGSDVELLNQSVRGQVVHEELIKRCNAEMSKAMTSQTLTSEISDQGSRAATSVHRDKETSVNECDRELVADTLNELFEWITIINVAGAVPPYFEFYDDAEARKDWVDVFDKARNLIDIPQPFVYQTLQIPQPKKGEVIVQRGATQQPFNNNDAGQPGEPEFNAPPGSEEFRTQQLSDIAADRADELLQQLPDAARTLLDEVDSLAEFQRRLPELYPKMDDTDLGELTSLALMTGLLHGMDSAESE